MAKKKVSRYNTIKNEVINKVADVMSYPKRTLYDAKASVANVAADKMLLIKEKNKLAVKNNSYPRRY